MRSIQIYLFSLISVILISGCGSSYASFSNEGKVLYSEVSGDWLDEYRNQQINWQSCGPEFFVEDNQSSLSFEKNEAKCAYLKVPVIYKEHKNPGDLMIAVIKDPADGTNKIGSVFTNPGGPGGSGVDMIQWGMFPQEVQDVYDIIGFDPRGVARSSPVKCDSETALSSLFNSYFDPSTTEQAQANAQIEKTYYENCKTENQYWYAMATDNVVQDLDILRAAITPDKPLNYVGHSYGTAIGARYITKFPKNSGRIILDSPIRDELQSEGWDAQGDSFKVARDLLFKKCAKDAKCPGNSVREVEQNFLVARDQILQGNMSGYVAQSKPSSFFTTKVKGSPDLLYDAILSLAYSDINSAYQEFLPAYKEMLSGSYIAFERMGLYFRGFDLTTLSNDNSFDMLELVNCLDVDSANYSSTTSSDTFESEFNDPFQPDAEYLGLPGCYWSIAAIDDASVDDPPLSTPPYLNESKSSFLVIGTSFDNATPYEWAVAVAADLHSPLITYEGTGHANLWSGIACIDNPAIDYLLNGELPSSDITCSADQSSRSPNQKSRYINQYFKGSGLHK